MGGASGCRHSGDLMCWVRVEANASATAHRAHGAACFSFFFFFRVGLWPRTWSLFLQVPRACAPFFWLFRVGCLGQLSVGGGWDLLMDGAPGCGWDLMGVARVGAKCPCLSFCSSGCACFSFPLGFCFSLHAGATAPATLVGRLVFGGVVFSVRFLEVRVADIGISMLDSHVCGSGCCGFFVPCPWGGLSVAAPSWWWPTLPRRLGVVIDSTSGFLFGGSHGMDGPGVSA